MDRNPGDNLVKAPIDVDLEKLKCNVEIWKKVIDVQQHFNTIEMQIRNFAVTILAGMLAATGLALREPKNIMVFNLTISSASAILISAIIVLFSFYFMDRFWYHRLLQGAVSRGEALEAEIKKILPEINLSQTIREESPVLGLRSNNKIDIFYGIIIVFLIVAAIGANNLGTDASNGMLSDETIYEGIFNISIITNTQNSTDSNAIYGKGVLGVQSNKTKFDLEPIFNEFY